MDMNKQELKTFADDFKKAVGDLEEQYGVVISINAIKYGFDNFTMKLSVANDGVDLEKNNWDNYCYSYSLHPSDYKKYINYNNQRFQLIGIKPESIKYPIVVKRDDGRLFKLPLDIVRNSLSNDIDI